MNVPTKSMMVKGCLSICWLAALIYYLQQRDWAGLLFFWIAVVGVSAMCFVDSAVEKYHAKNAGWIFCLLLFLSLLITAFSFLGLVAIGSIDYEMPITREGIDSWIFTNALQTIGFSGMVLISMLLPRKLLNWQSRLLTYVAILFMMVSIAESVYSWIGYDSILGWTWRKWSDFAWGFQMFYFHFLFVYLMLAFGVFLYRIGVVTVFRSALRGSGEYDKDN